MQNKQAALGQRKGPEVSSGSALRKVEFHQRIEYPSKRVFAERIVRLNAHEYAQRCQGKLPFTIA